MAQREEPPCIYGTRRVFWEQISVLNKNDYFIFITVDKTLLSDCTAFHLQLCGQYAFSTFKKACNITCSRLRTKMLSRTTMKFQLHFHGRLFDVNSCFSIRPLPNWPFLHFLVPHTRGSSDHESGKLEWLINNRYTMIGFFPSLF